MRHKTNCFYLVVKANNAKKRRQIITFWFLPKKELVLHVNKKSFFSRYLCFFVGFPWLWLAAHHFQLMVSGQVWAHTHCVCVCAGQSEIEIHKSAKVTKLLLASVVVVVVVATTAAAAAVVAVATHATFGYYFCCYCCSCGSRFLFCGLPRGLLGGHR